MEPLKSLGALGKYPPRLSVGLAYVYNTGRAGCASSTEDSCTCSAHHHWREWHQFSKNPVQAKKLTHPTTSSFICQWSQERHFASVQHWHDQCQTVQSELHTPLPPSTGGEVVIQQWGGRHSHFLIMYLCVLEKGVPLKITQEWALNYLDTRGANRIGS